MSRLKAVLFDMDGTLCDTLPLCVMAFQEAVREVTGKQLTRAEVLSSFGPSEEGSIRVLLPENPELGLNRFWHWYEKLHGMCPTLVPGTREVLDYLKEHGIFLGLVTGKGPKSCQISMKYYALENVFHQIETGSPDGVIKSDGIKKIITGHNFSSDEVIYVGDVPADIISAHKAGVPIASVLWGCYCDETAIRALNPDMIFYKVGDFFSYLKKRIEE